MAKVKSGLVDSYTDPVDEKSKSPVVDAVPQASGGPENNDPVAHTQPVPAEHPHKAHKLKHAEFDQVFQVEHIKDAAKKLGVTVSHDEDHGAFIRVSTSVGPQIVTEGMWLSHGANGWHVGLSDPRDNS